MKTLAYLPFLALAMTVSAQRKTMDFDLILADQKISHSLYGSIALLDSRQDTSSLGQVQDLGAWSNPFRTVVVHPSLAGQLNTLLASMVDSSAGNGGLLLQLRIFSFQEPPRSAKQYCFLRLELYARADAGYRKLAFLDTALATKAGKGRGDIPRIMEATARALRAFIADNLTREAPAGDAYALADLPKIDSIEKSKIPLYTATTYTDGIYPTYASFENLVPEGKVTKGRVEGGQLKSIKTIGLDGTPVPLRSKDVYAVVYQGQPFISTSYGFYKLYKEDSQHDDLIFIGRRRAAPNQADVMVATMAFGIIGGLLASNVTGLFEQKIDHVTGQVIVLRQIQEPPASN